MKWSHLIGLSISGLILGGCASPPNWWSGATNQPAQVTESVVLCVNEEQEDGKAEQCKVTDWLAYWIQHNGQAWVQRQTLISQLGDTSSDKLKQVLLSQGKGTPYQARLRAQSMLDGLLNSTSENLTHFLRELVYLPSQEILEYESALTILTRVNANQARELEKNERIVQQQQEQIAKQQEKIEQFLKIEASMMDKREGINP